MPPSSAEPRARSRSSSLIQLNGHVFVWFVCCAGANRSHPLTERHCSCSFVLKLPRPLLCACLGWAGIKEEERRLLLYFIGGRQVGAGPRAITAKRHLQLFARVLQSPHTETLSGLDLTKFNDLFRLSSKYLLSSLLPTRSTRLCTAPLTFHAEKLDMAASQFTQSTVNPRQCVIFT